MDTITEKQLIQHPPAEHGNLVGYCLWLGLVLGACYLLSPYDEPAALLPLYAIEGILALAAFHSLCPWLRHQATIMAALLFTISFGVAALVVADYSAEFNAPWSWSDDWHYVLDAEFVAEALRSSHWNLLVAWNDYTANVMHWSLAGWPFLLGTVSSVFLPEGAPLEAYHAVALSLNALFLTVTLAMMFHVLGDAAKRPSWRLLLCFLLMAGSPLVYAGESRKESMLQFALMAAFMAGTMNVKRGFLRPALWLIVAMLSLATTRTIYLIIPAAIIYLRVSESFGIKTLRTIVVGAAVLLAAYPILQALPMREQTVGQFIASRAAEGLNAEMGLGMRIYSTPVVGPAAFYLLSPLPINPLNTEASLSKVLVSAGNVFYVLGFLYVGYCLLLRGRALFQGVFPFAAITFLFVFGGTVLVADDPRYKQPSNFYLAMMLYLALTDAHRVAVCRSLAGNCLPGPAGQPMRGRRLRTAG
ncbi:MAG: hypothetical protein ABFC96_05845 [Thermoguttaceae bacterium]